MNGAAKAGAAILWVAGIAALAYGAVSLRIPAIEAGGVKQALPWPETPLL